MPDHEPRESVNMLEPLVIEQRQELSHIQLPETIYSGDRRIFVANYVASDLFRSAFLDASHLILGPHSAQDAREFNRRLSGRMFSDLARCYLSARGMDGYVVVAPERTHKFYTLLYTGMETTEHSITGNSINGIHVPDGLIANRKEIQSVCEYTAISQDPENPGTYDDYFRAKYDGFTQVKARFPEYFAKSRLLFVVPGPKPGDDPDPRFCLPADLRNIGGIRIQRVNFDHNQFGQLVKGVIALLS